MGNDLEQSEEIQREPMPLYKAIGGLVVIYALVGGPALWKLRRNCLLKHDDCDGMVLLEWLLSDRLSLIASVIILAILLQITWHFVGLVRHGIPVEEDKPKRRFNVNGLAIAIVVNLLYLAIALPILAGALGNLGSLDESDVSSFVWRTTGPMYGASLVLFGLWYVNDYFVKPAPFYGLLLLFLANLGVFYYVGQSLILNF